MRRLIVALVAALALAGCSTHREGAVGDVLDGSTMHVKLLRFQQHSPVRHGSDVTGFSIPPAGKRFAGAEIVLCNDYGYSTGPWQFTVALKGGGTDTAHLLYGTYPPSQQFEGGDDTGCTHGWLSFTVPKDATVERLEYRFDDTGAYHRFGASRDPEHDRFDWSV